MTQHCSLKEAFIGNQLDKFQPGWRKGEDITSETKQKIREYAVSKMPEGLLESEQCITDYVIWHMARNIRERENLPKPHKSNKGNKVNIHQPSEEKTITSDPPEKTYHLRPREEASPSDSGKEQASEFVSADPSVHALLVEILRQLIKRYGVNEFKPAMFAIWNEIKTLEEGEADSESTGCEKGEI